MRVPRAGVGQPRRRPDAVIADKAYSSRAIRQTLRGRGSRAVIPERADQKTDHVRRGRAGGGPPAFDRDLYKGRNVVERCFNRLKQFRAIATRFDELAACHRTGLHLAALILWLREPSCPVVLGLSVDLVLSCGVARFGENARLGTLSASGFCGIHGEFVITRGRRRRPRRTNRSGRRRAAWRAGSPWSRPVQECGALGSP